MDSVSFFAIFLSTMLESLSHAPPARRTSSRMSLRSRAVNALLFSSPLEGSPPVRAFAALSAPGKSREAKSIRMLSSSFSLFFS